MRRSIMISYVGDGRRCIFCTRLSLSTLFSFLSFLAPIERSFTPREQGKREKRRQGNAVSSHSFSDIDFFPLPAFEQQRGMEVINQARKRHA